MRHTRPNTLFKIDTGQTLAPCATADAGTGLTRRRWLSGAAGCALSGALPLTTGSAQAQAPWPARPIQLIVPWPAGGATDLTLRVLTEEAERLLGHPFYIVNRPGAAGTQVAHLLKMAEPDGHTIGQVPITVYRHALMHNVPWNPVTDFSPIVQVSGTTFGILVPTSSPFKGLDELIEWAKRHPGELIVGSTGIGTTAHLAMEEILLQHQVRYVHVPYKGTADQMMAVAGAQLMAGVNSTGFAPWVDQGKIRLLAIFSARRSARWPEVPTLRELGYEHSVYTSPWGLAAPAGTPEWVVQQLHGVFQRAMFSDRHQQALARYDQVLDYLNTADYRQAVLDTVDRERRLLRRMNLLARVTS